MRTVHYWNYSCNEHRETTCDVDCLDDFTWCENEDEYYEMVEYSSYEQCYIPSDEAVFSNHLDDYIYKCNARYCGYMGDWLPEDDYDDILAEWRLEHEEELCEAV